MGKVKDRLVGKAKEAIAEVIGDGKLAEEGKEQVEKAAKEPGAKPLGNLDKLT
jgi:uncharacterized protein YjbJ (UPF0337 family)